MNNKLKTYSRPDTMQDIQNTDLVQLSRRLLDAAVESTDALNIGEMDSTKLKELKMVLGFLNATNSIVKTKMQYFKMIGIKDKVRTIRKLSNKVEEME